MIGLKKASPMVTLNTPEQIARARLLTLRAALRLEIAGMTRRGRPASAILREMGFTGKTKVQVLESVNAHLDQEDTHAKDR